VTARLVSFCPELMQLALTAHRMISERVLVGWDFAITENGPGDCYVLPPPSLVGARCFTGLSAGRSSRCLNSSFVTWDAVTFSPVELATRRACSLLSQSSAKLMHWALFDSLDATAPRPLAEQRSLAGVSP
jgi:hypothetical protein